MFFRITAFTDAHNAYFGREAFLLGAADVFGRRLVGIRGASCFWWLSDERFLDESEEVDGLFALIFRAIVSFISATFLCTYGVLCVFTVFKGRSALVFVTETEPEHSPDTPPPSVGSFILSLIACLKLFTLRILGLIDQRFLFSE